MMRLTEHKDNNIGVQDSIPSLSGDMNPVILVNDLITNQESFLDYDTTLTNEELNFESKIENEFTPNKS